jgi:antitoxin CptB
MREPEHPSPDARRRRLLFRATHRGTHETDLLIGGFVRARLDGFSEEELDVLEAVIELPDVDLADWLSGRRPIPPALPESTMLTRMREAVGR